MSDAMQIIIGAPATGSDFYPRERITERLLRALRAEHVLFLAPRRTGKTSVLLNLKERAPARAAFLNLEEFDHPALWIKAMAGEMSKIQDEPWLQKLKQAGDLLPRLKTRYGHLEAADWTARADGLMEDLQALGEPVWFLLDEFPTMIDLIAKHQGVAMAESALHWLRRVRQQTGSPVRFLLTGSIGLDSVLRRWGIRGPANDLRRESLAPLEEEEALELALRLASDNRVPLNEPLAREYVQRLGPARWPFFIQLFLAELQDSGPSPEYPANLDRIYQAVAYSRRNQYADNMWNRLHDIFNPAEAAIAREVLRSAAGAERGVFYDELRARLPNAEAGDYEYVMEVLHHDGYLMETAEGRICFFSHPLRDYWLRKRRV